MMCDMVNRKAKRLAKRFLPFYLFTFINDELFRQ